MQLDWRSGFTFGFPEFRSCVAVFHLRACFPLSDALSGLAGRDVEPTRLPCVSYTEKPGRGFVGCKM